LKKFIPLPPVMLMLKTTFNLDPIFLSYEFDKDILLYRFYVDEFYVDEMYQYVLKKFFVDKRYNIQINFFP
jgi:hypothetical protein